MTINEAQDEVIEQFQDFTDWMDKYQLLIDLGGDLEPLDDKYKNEQNLIDGCQSRVWVQCDMTDDGRLVFTADSDALIVKASSLCSFRLSADIRRARFSMPTSTSSSASV